MTERRPIAGELKAWRTRLAVSQVDAAARLHVSYGSYRGWEGGKPCWMPDAILLLAWFIEGVAAGRTSFRQAEAKKAC